MDEALLQLPLQQLEGGGTDSVGSSNFHSPASSFKGPQIQGDRKDFQRTEALLPVRTDGVDLGELRRRLRPLPISEDCRAKMVNFALQTARRHENPGQ